MLGICQSLILSKRKFRPEKKVRKGSPVQYPMHHHLLFRHFKVKAPLLGSKAVERLPVALDFSKAFIVEILQILLRDLEFIQQFKLLQRIQLGNFSRADFIEDDL